MCPLQTPEATPPASPRDRQAKAAAQAKRGSTVSPGEAALAASAQWLEVLVCCQAVASLPPSALSLMSDLVQLLYYHGSGVAQLGAAADGQDMQLLSPVVQVRQVMITADRRNMWLHVCSVCVVTVSVGLLGTGRTCSCRLRSPACEADDALVLHMCRLRMCRLHMSAGSQCKACSLRSRVAVLLVQ